MAHCFSNFHNLLSYWPLNLPFTLLFFLLALLLIIIVLVTVCLKVFPVSFVILQGNYRKLNNRDTIGMIMKDVPMLKISFIKIRRPLKR